MAIVLNGTSQYGTIDNANACPVQGQDFWLTCWIKKNGAPVANGHIVGWTEAGVNDSVCSIRMNTSGQLGIAAKADNAGAITTVFGTANCADNGWHFVVLWVSHAGLAVNAVVDSGATVLTRPISLGQTLALTRLCLGVQVRAAVDTTLYWGGEIAEVQWGRGTITEAAARALYNLGYPVRGQGPTRNGRYPLIADANEVGGAGPNFTLTGSPTYSDDSAHFNAINAFTAIAIDNDTAAAILEAGMESATSHRQAITVVSPCYGVLGVVHKNDDVATAGQTATMSVPSLANHTVSLSSAAFANRLSEYVENSSRNFHLPFAGTFVTQVTIPAGTLRGVSVRADTSRGLVPLFGHSFHCSPTRVTHLGSEWRVHAGMDQRGAGSLVKNGSLVFTDDRDARAGDDTYHIGMVIAPQPSGVALFNTEHNGDLEVCYVPDVGLAGLPTWYEISLGGEHTYGQLKWKSDGTVYLMNRGSSNGTDTDFAVVYHITGIDAGVPTVVSDDLGQDTTRQYPGTVYLSGTLVGFAWTGAWNYGFAAIYDTAADKWYDLAKNQRGGNVKGIPASPRFNNTEWTTTQVAGTGVRIYGNASGSTYQSCALFDLTDWAATGGKAAFLYSETAGATNEFAATTIRWVVQDGATRYVSGVDFASPADWTCNYWRVFSKAIWKDGDPSTGIAYLCVIDHDDRDTGGNYDTALPTGYTPYYDQGGQRIRVYKVTNPCSSSPTFELLDSPALTAESGLTAGWVRDIPGELNTFAWQEATTELTEFKRGTLDVEYEVVEAASSGARRRRLFGFGLWQ